MRVTEQDLNFCRINSSDDGNLPPFASVYRPECRRCGTRPLVEKRCIISDGAEPQQLPLKAVDGGAGGALFQEGMNAVPTRFAWLSQRKAALEFGKHSSTNAARRCANGSQTRRAAFEKRFRGFVKKRQSVMSRETRLQGCFLRK